MCLNKFSIVFIAIINVFTFDVYSQNIKTDIASINKTYDKLDKFSMTFEMNMFENYQTQKVYYTESGIIQKNGASTFQKFENTECVNTPNYSVIIDEEEKDVVYAPKKQTFKSNDPSLLLDLDSVLMLCKKHSFKKNADNLVSYSFLMIDEYPEYNQIVVYFNPSSFLIQKIVFYCEEDDISMNNEEEKNAKARVEINYKNINTKPSLVPSDFTYEKYLVKQGNKFELKPLFKSYNLTVLSF